MFGKETISNLKEQTQNILKETEEALEESKGAKTDSGRKAKEATKAEQAQVWAEVLQPVFFGINAGVTKLAEELSHTDDEIKTLALLTGKVAPKYIDFDMEKFSDESKLISYLIMIETAKIQAYLKSKTDKEKESESKRNNNNSRKDGFGEITSDKNQTNKKTT